MFLDKPHPFRERRTIPCQQFCPTNTSHLTAPQTIMSLS
ncbi:hypothetical protein ACPOL_4336 [Acidisarcina polymorpha]|uniref:Uncharacterized protein n=1 Tax=Acidisarcina polymorpha TaxID=2211140 RepID=A0A2Z5G3B2_9BACT|nr:hypothetical protein ACPOL_4336 [Acidisarcina polymorpha]